MHLVRENLFIGNIGDAAEVLQNGSTKIAHILSVLRSASISFFSEWRSGLTIPTKEIKKIFFGGSGCAAASGDHSDDGPKSSLSPQKLLYLLEYAGKDLKLVRMAVPIRDMENALESLRQSCEFVCPNDGFSEQLKMFEETGLKVDHTSPINKQFRLKVLGDCYNCGEKIDGSKLGADPGLPTESSSVVEASLNKGISGTAYHCKKCRRVVALQDNVVDHFPVEGETSFEWHKWRSGKPFNKCAQTECLSVFVEPLQWMTAVEEGAIEGKLWCAHCEACLGYFNWSGIQCSCGSWITPAFQLHKSRVDISTVWDWYLTYLKPNH